MRPWIRDGDVIEIEPVRISDLKPGDVVFYRRVQGFKGSRGEAERGEYGVRSRQYGVKAKDRKNITEDADIKAGFKGSRGQGVKEQVPNFKSQISNSTKSLVAHRLIARYHCYDGRVRLICQGDALARPDPLIGPDEVLGRVVAVNRDGRRIELRSAFYRLIGLGMIATLPLRMMVYPILRKVIRGLRIRGRRKERKIIAKTAKEA